MMAVVVYTVILAVMAGCRALSRLGLMTLRPSSGERTKCLTTVVPRRIKSGSHSPPSSEAKDSERIPLYYRATTYISYAILIGVGLIRDFFGKRFYTAKYRYLKCHSGYAPLNPGFDNFYLRRLHSRMDDCFERVTTGVPGRNISLVDSTNGSVTKTLNLGSYNYLGFAQSSGLCAQVVESTIRSHGIGSTGSRAEVGAERLHIEVENEVAAFVGKQAAIVFSMGFSTNSNVFPELVDKRCLVLSDELKHSSIRFGTRLSGATTAVFKHNNLNDLEEKLRAAICHGAVWDKILVVVEGLYSMEGTLCDLPGLIALKQRYKFYLFVDEAHSIGAIGSRGKGLCDYFGVDSSKVDILMGTFTKSFGANGGYIAANREVINKLRATNPAVMYSEAPAPAVLAQILTAIKIINGAGSGPGEGRARLNELLYNSRYLRDGLKRLGYTVYGSDDSPIIPALLLHPAKMAAFSREMLSRKISVVVIGYPAVPLLLSRVRFCVSASHTKEDLDRVLSACDQVANLLQLRWSSRQ